MCRTTDDRQSAKYIYRECRIAVDHNTSATHLSVSIYWLCVPERVQCRIAVLIYTVLLARTRAAIP